MAHPKYSSAEIAQRGQALYEREIQGSLAASDRGKFLVLDIENWFRLLDEVVEGEVVLIERDGARLRLALSEPAEPSAKVPDYRALIRVPDLDAADQWGWEWDGSPEGLRSRQSEPES